ncbi:MAG: hypothetical protein JRI66_12955 [Deltaproteobacteria bacterium]|nr:hypothetical protein [Deltaproteobacteria bacterium]
MKAIAFDTLEFAKRLREAEFTEKQAEALATAVAEIIESRLATKEDVALLQRDIEQLRAEVKRDIEELRREIEGLRVELKRDIEELRAEVKRDMKEMELRLKHDLTLRLGLMMTAAVAIVAALVKLL